MMVRPPGAENCVWQVCQGRRGRNRWKELPAEAADR